MRKILIVDNKGSMVPLSLKLERRGYLVAVAENADQALTLGRIARPSVILVDLAHGGVDGCDVTRKLKSAASTRHIPVIAFGDPSREEDCDRALNAGCDDFLARTARFQQLLSKIDWLVEKALFIPTVPTRMTPPAVFPH
jgi:two-component system cell cycle response regulator DivK